MTDPHLTERQQREKQYYAEYSRRTAPTEISFDAILGHERRPWNAYWFVSELVMRHFTSKGQKLLDIGCGPGIYSLQFARIGYEVFGFDIASHNITVAKRLAEQYGLEDRTHFAFGITEHLDYPCEYFDVVAGIDILHHVQIAQSVKECLRVLKRGGVAIFKEPIEAPIFDRLRNTRLGKWLYPKTMSFERHITADEKKLTVDDLMTMRELCPALSIRRFRLFSRLDKIYRNKNAKKSPPILAMVAKVDEWVLRAFPFLRPLGGEIVLTLTK
jgi:2-polyprenyl-3-methyl-5-hydroxy-6-metoxy-1,4-benzoquinol methylase